MYLIDRKINEIVQGSVDIFSSMELSDKKKNCAQLKKHSEKCDFEIRD